VEQHLEKARNARGKKKGVVVEPNKTQLRKARKQTDRLVIEDTGTKVYAKSKVVKNVRKQYSKKDYSMFKPGVFVSIRNASVKKGRGTPTNPFYCMARIKAARGKEFELTWFKEGKKNMYRAQSGGIWVEHQTSFNMVKPSSFVKGVLRLTDDDWKTLHT
jgi:hypothetical protein